MKARKFLSLLVAIAMIFSMMSVPVFADTENDGVKQAPTGTVTLAYTREENGYVRVWGEGGGNATESLKFELYSDDTKIATTQLNNVGGIIDGDVYVTWNFFYPNSNDEYWTTIWEEGHPNSAAQPTKVVLYVDGVAVAENVVKMNAPDDVAPVVWAELGGVKKIVTGLSGEGTAEDPYLINNIDDLKWFRDKVDEQASDGSTQFAGKHFKLTSDIDLAGINWNPIGSMSGDHSSFKGVFDGDGHTISNLYVETSGEGIGFFARTAGNAEIKNLTFNNATVKSTNNSSYAGVVVANSYASTKITNVHVTGTIYVSGRGYIGGISGHGYVVMDNVSVKAEGTITSTFWCAGGILGYGGEGATNITNAYVEGTGETGLLVTSAAGGLGAIVGMAEDNEGTQPISGANLTAKNVRIETYVGGYGTSYADYALGYLYGGNPTSKLTGDLVVENVEIKTSTGDTSPEVSDAVAKINNSVYFSLSDAIKAAVSGDVVTIMKEGTYSLPSLGKDITIKAVDNIDVTFDNIGALNLGSANAKFENITFDYYPNQDYTGLQHSGNLTYTNCTFNGQVFLYGISETFNECTFNQNSSGAYNVWTYGAANVAFNECIFNCAGKSVLVYNEGACVTKLTTQGCEFVATQAVEGKAAIEIDTTLMPDGTEIIINNSTAEGFDEGSVSGNILWNDKKDQPDLTVTVDGTIVWPKIYVAEVNGVKYETLAEAVSEAGKGDIIVLLANVTEDVTVKKSIIIDGVGYNYTGMIEISGNYKVTIRNVNFINGDEYAVRTSGVNTVTVEKCTVSNYSYGFLYAPKSTANIIIKDVTVNNCNYGLHWYYGTNATLENVTMNDVKYGVRPRNYATKTITIKNCNISGTYPISIWEQTSAVQTFKFEGTNKLSGLSESEYAKYVLADTTAALIAPADFNVTTNIDGYMVEYVDNTYKVGKIIIEEEKPLGEFAAFIRNIRNDDGEYNVILIGGVDSLNYTNVGFKIILDGEELESYTTNKVGTKLKVSGNTYGYSEITPDMLGGGAKYLFADLFTMGESYKDKSLVFTPFATTFDNEIIYGPETKIEKIYNEEMLKNENVQ